MWKFSLLNNFDNIHIDVQYLFDVSVVCGFLKDPQFFSIVTFQTNSIFFSVPLSVSTFLHRKSKLIVAYHWFIYWCLLAFHNFSSFLATPAASPTLLTTTKMVQPCIRNHLLDWKYLFTPMSVLHWWASLSIHCTSVLAKFIFKSNRLLWSSTLLNTSSCWSWGTLLNIKLISSAKRRRFDSWYFWYPK